MKTIDAKQYLIKMSINRDKTPVNEYPFTLPVIASLNELYFHPKVTFFVGENGTGKSTVLEAIAVAYGFNPEGGSKNFNFTTRASHSMLSQYIKLQKGIKPPKDGYFLRAESFFNVATNIEELRVTGYGEDLLHEKSHGEAFMALFLNRFWGNGLYILDEPEAALSPMRQMSLLCRIHELIEKGSQFIIATHSPIIMSYPDADIYNIAEQGMTKTSYEETEHFIINKRFANNYKSILNELFSESE